PMTEKARLAPGSPCTNCSKCCTNPSFMGTLKATGEDVERWRREGRQDILRFADVVGPRNDPWADLWIDSQAPDHRDSERFRCPFVRKRRWADNLRAVPLADLYALLLAQRADGAMQQLLETLACAARRVEEQHAAGFDTGALPGVRHIAWH